MPTYLAVSGLIIVTLAILYLHTRIRYSQFLRHSRAEQTKLQSELSNLQKKILFSSRDPVTHLLGWQLFEDRVNQGIKECARFKFLLGVLYVDIDNFKLINNALGHEGGNALLKETAERLESCVRQVDSISRQGKDTFAILLAQLSKTETAAIIIQRMLQTMSQPFIINENKLTVTACIGASFYPADGTTTGELMHNAEYAMLLAKARGKHLYQFYQESLQADSQRELALYNNLSSDSFLDELKLYYQPVMNVKDHAMCCTATQIVWNHPVVGQVSGEELFMHADKQRKLNKITEQVLAESCKKFLQWRELGLKPQMLGIPVLLKQLENTQFIYRLSQIMQATKMQPAWVMLEIRECSAPVSLDILEKSFNMLRYLGVKVAIDHFGSGSFSLRYLKTFSVHYLRLDPAMIIDVAQNEQTRAIVKAVADFAADLSLEVIATGVESQEQVEVLQELGIILMQGQLLSEPLSEAEMAVKMASV
jgi:diguanylate cyclase (GGDEF)-like protein